MSKMVSTASAWVKTMGAYFTRSASVNGRRGLSASLLMSASETGALDGGCDHF
jgi:hypothetical protein